MIVVALDHGSGMGAIDGFEDPQATLDAMLAGDPDGVPFGPYFAGQFADTFATASTDILPPRFETGAESVANACRIGWVLWADTLKAPYTGDHDSFGPIVRNGPVPVLILGGPSSESVQAMLNDVVGAITAGARGIVLGRSVWQIDDPAAVVSARRRVVHDSDAPEAVWSA